MVSSKDIFTKVLNLEKTGRLPVAPFWWGTYKYETLGLDYRKDAWKEGNELSKVYKGFYRMFKPDWFHLHIGTPIYFKDLEIIRKDSKFYLIIDPKYGDVKKEDKYFSVNSSHNEEIVDFLDYLLGSRCYKHKVDLSSKAKIDEYIEKYVHMSAEEIMNLGYPDHVVKIVEEYGNQAFIGVHIDLPP